MRISDWSSDVCSSDLFDGWRVAARAFALAGTKPADILWQTGDEGDLFAADEAPPPVGEVAFSVPRAFVELAERAILHRDAERFALLYALDRKSTRLNSSH